MIGIPNEHQLKFNSIKDAKKLIEAVKKRFGRNTATKKTQRNLLKQQYENFTAPSSEMLDQTFDRLQNLVNDMEEMDLRWQMAMLTIRARRSLKNTRKKLAVNGNETIGFDKSKVECYNYHKRGRFVRECRASRNKDNKNKESSRRSLPVETFISTALVSCDGLGGYDWSDQAEEGPNYVLMAFSSSSFDSDRINRTLIEAAKTMIANFKLPTTFWAEAVSTACYVQNRVLVVKPHNNTPCELFHGRTPSLSFIRPFGCLVTIFNAIDHLGKFDGKADEGFFVGYSLNSKAFRVFNSRTRIVEENMHIRFSESTPNVVGSGPDWLFDIDALTRIMNYKPIVVDPKSSHDDGYKPTSDDAKKGDEDLRKEGECKYQEKEDNVNSTNNVNVAGNVNIVSSTVNVAGTNEVNVVGYTQEERIDDDEVFAFIARIEAIMLFLAYALFKDFLVYQMDVKSAFLYRKIKEEVYVCQPPGFEDLDFHDRVYKVGKALYGLHQAARAWYETLPTYMLDNGFQKRKIDKTLFIKRYKDDILLVQVYVDDIIFGLQVKQKKDGIFISQDKYVTKILNKFGFTKVKTASTSMETQKPLLKDEDGEEIDVHIYQVNPKVLLLYAMKRIFRYLKGQPKLGLWYPKDSPFDLVAYTDSDYAGASLDKKSTIIDDGKAVWNEIRVNAGDSKLMMLGITYYCWVKVYVVEDGVVHKELGDSLVMVATTAFSLEVEQDNGNINKTQSKATPNESSSQGTNSSEGPWVESSSNEEILGKDASKQGRIDSIDADEEIVIVNVQDEVVSNDADEEMFDVDVLDGEEVFVVEHEVVVNGVNDEVNVVDKVTEVINTAKLIINVAQDSAAGDILSTATTTITTVEKRRKHFAAKRAEEKRNKPPTKAQQRKIMCTYLKNMEGYKLKDLKLKEFGSIQEMFDKAFKSVNTFEEFRTELVEGKEKRAGTELIHEITKK
nr:retrovirus-related Pol polyprotein from transposon TNT 1-94 [Tanacetum cinerariifolium]